MATKEEFFYMPKSVREITHGRKPYKGAFELSGVVDVIENLHENEYLELNPVEHPLLPWPFGANYALKHCHPLRLHNYRSEGAAIAAGKEPLFLRTEAFENLQEERKRSPLGFVYHLGLFWEGFEDNTPTIVYLADACDAALYYLFSEHHASEGEKTDVNIYPPLGQLTDAQREDARRNGRKIFCKVPSRSRDSVHSFTMQRVPTEDSPEKYALALSIRSDHACGDTANLVTRFPGIGYRYEGAHVEDEHVIAAYARAVDILQKRHRDMRRTDKSLPKACVALQANPYPLPTERELALHQKALSQVLIWRPCRSNGRTRWARKPPDEAVLESLHMNSIAKNGHGETFTPVTPIRNYKIVPIERRAV